MLNKDGEGNPGTDGIWNDSLGLAFVIEKDHNIQLNSYRSGGPMWEAKADLYSK